MTASKSKRAIRDDLPFTILNYALLSLLAISVLYPLCFVVSCSFSSTSAVSGGRVWLWPVEPTLDGYKAVFNNRDIGTGFFNSFIYMVTGTLCNLIVTLSAAYPLSRADLKARKPIMMLFTFTMFFSGGLIPSYMLVANLGMLNSRLAIILPGALNVWYAIIARQFFRSNIPGELLEASKLDGCSDFRFIFYVVIPLSGAIIAVLSLFFAVNYWNSYFTPLLYLSDRAKYPLQVFLREILIQNSIDTKMTFSDTADEVAKQGLSELLKYSLIVVASLPVMAIYPFVQKFFIKGVMIGAIKG